MRRIPLLLALLATLTTAPAFADCTDTTGVYINEIRYIDMPSPMGSRIHALVELYNKGTTSVPLDGWTITDEAGSPKFTFPAVSLPGGAFIEVEFGPGTTDLDLSDGLGRVATNGDSIDVFDEIAGGIALYAGAVLPANVRDFVAWSADGSAPSGAAASDAIAASLWPAFETVAVTDSFGLFTLRLLPDGVDDSTSTAWHHNAWGDSWYQQYVEGSNPTMISPGDSTALEPGPITFSWSGSNHPGTSYRIIVATDPSLTTGIVVDGTTTSLDTTVTLADDLHFWTVRHVDSCGETPGPTWALDVWTMPSAAQGGRVTAQSVGGTPEWGFVGIARITQHKDSRLLCLYDARNNRRPGCTRWAGQRGPWDGAHPLNHAPNCRHCGMYCARASAQMINRHYGGTTLTQDHIAFFGEQGNSRIGQPEKNLSHGAGVWPVEAEGVLEAALTGENVTALNATYAWLKTEIQEGNPVFVARPGHAMVVSGFVEKDALAANRPAWNVIQITDPWPTQPPSRLRSLGASQIVTMWVVDALPGQTIGGRAEFPEVTTDTDGDGVMDFDEGAPNYPLERPRRLGSSHMDPDSDNDDLYDKTDIALYTFHTCLPNDSLSFPDRDGDGLRGEADCDSDNGGLFDGGEDRGGAGLCNDWTDAYNPAGDGIGVKTDKGWYWVGEEVKLEGMPFHADTTYPFGTLIDCPDLVHMQGIPSAGALATGNDGVMPLQKIADCSDPGLFLTVVDVLRNATYEEPRCQNPWTCWICLEEFWTTSLDDTITWSDLSLVKYDPGSVDWQITTDFMHNGTGYHLELNGPGNPGNPIDAAVRLPPFVANAGDQVFVTYWTTFFSQNMQGVIRVSTDNGATWNPVLNYGPPDNQFQGEQVIDITPALFGPAPPGGYAALADSTVPCLVEFHAIGPPASGGWFLDDLGIGAIPAPTVSVPGTPTPAPSHFHLAQNNPNPFTSTTTIGFDVPNDAGHVRLDVYDIAGRKVRTLQDGQLSPGRHVRIWNGRHESGGAAPAGIYFYRLQGRDFSAVRRMSKVVR